MRLIWWRHGKTTLKPFDALTQKEIAYTRLAAKRAALHRAVDMGLFDDNIHNVEDTDATRD